jgi:hypothetical protein
MEEKCLSDRGRDHLEFEGCFLTRRRGGAETAEIIRLRSEAHAGVQG